MTRCSSAAVWNVLVHSLQAHSVVCTNEGLPHCRGLKLLVVVLDRIAALLQGRPDFKIQ